MATDPPALPPEPLFDLTGLPPAEARDYVLSITAHLKQTEAEVEAARQDQRLWNDRAALADRAGQTELAAQARAQADGAGARLAEREAEVREFQAGVERLKSQLLLLPLTQRTVNTDALLENLAALGGPLDTVSPTLKRAEADEALAALKKKMAGEA